jgi:hypothetical protein
MHNDVRVLILEYVDEMQALEEFIELFNDYYFFLETRFSTVEDIISFLCFIQMKLPGVYMFKCLGCCRECGNERDGTWSYIPSGPHDVLITVNTLLEFVRQTDQICEHEALHKIFKHQNTAFILLKPRDARETATSPETGGC